MKTPIRFALLALLAVIFSMALVPLVMAQDSPPEWPMPYVVYPYRRFWASGSQTSTAAVTPTPEPKKGQIVVSAKAKDIYQKGLKLGNNPKAFSKIGDCMSTTPFFLAPFDNPKQYRLTSDLTYLQDTVDNFRGSFSRESIAAKDGFSAASLFNPRVIESPLCGRTESPLNCELRLNKPSIVIISLGTNGSWLTSEQFEEYMRSLVNTLSASGVLPILSTKADNLEGDGRLNAVVIKLAKEYDLPLWDYYTVAEILPKRGITDGQYHMDWAPPILDDGIKTGWQLRNVSALQALDSVWKGVKESK